MKVYVAGSWDDRWNGPYFVADRLKQYGFEITYEWWFDNECGPDKAARDLQGVRDADILVAVMYPWNTYRGTYVEIGYALALGKQVYILGSGADKCIFTNLPLVKVVK